MIFEKENNLSQPRSRRGGAFRFLRSRSGKKRGPGKNDFWQALSSAALSSPHAPVLRRLHD